ncbi:MAG: hypothetical protein IJU63_07405 [Bacteroidales bacterium]|nr:hypothetical protein [Bacteroidales bacterium]
MKKHLRILLCLIGFCLCGSPLQARSPWNFSLEWGYTAAFFNHYRYNYFDSEGSRVNDEGWQRRLLSNGNLRVGAGYHLSDCWNLSLMAGFEGLYEDRRVIPTTLRGTFLPEGRSRSGWILFAEGGAGWTRRMDFGPAILARGGAGWRLPMDGGISLDVLVSLHASFDHPPVLDPEHHEISRLKVRSTTANYYGINFSLSLNF